jgi:osmotically inducible lipoprotein OsmB
MSGCLMHAVRFPIMELQIMTRAIATAILFSGLALSLSACGRSTGDRAVSGGLLGAGAGAAVGAVTGGSVGTGALIGGALGAAGGAVTSPGTVNLGRPAWR